MDRLAWIDQEMAHVAELICRVGWFIPYIGGETCSRPGCCSPPGDGPPFAYTIGLFGMGHAELLIFGIDPGTTNAVLSALAGRIRQGETLMPGGMLTIENWSRRIVPEEVPNPGDIVLWANDFYQRPAGNSVPVLQLTYDDSQGLFPWDEGYATPELQPRPGSFAA